MSFDPRVTLFRDGLADARLEGLIIADRFAPVRPSQVVAPTAALRAAPDLGAEQVDQLLFGEGFDVLEAAGDFVLGQSVRDGYVGYVGAAALAATVIAPTHWISALRAFAFAEPSIKAHAAGPLSFNALVTIVEETQTLARAERIGWIAKAHLEPIGSVLDDPAAAALMHLGAPYLWGGRDSAGLDCSGLIQQALFACGLSCPRDSDQQELLGAPAPPEGLGRSDLVFWPGHVGMMLDAKRLIHANAFAMAVTIEPLARARKRIGEPIACRRLKMV
ncbi:MAG TPA: NlpC/P60 family protein [Caulobacteraceae bacterium]